MPYVLGTDGCWHYRLVVKPIINFKIVAGATGCVAALGLGIAIGVGGGGLLLPPTNKNPETSIERNPETPIEKNYEYPPSKIYIPYQSTVSNVPLVTNVTIPSNTFMLPALFVIFVIKFNKTFSNGNCLWLILKKVSSHLRMFMRRY